MSAADEGQLHSLITVHDCAVHIEYLHVRKSPITNTAWVRVQLCKLQKKGALDSQPQVIKFTSCLPRVGGSLQVLRLRPSLKLVAMI